MASPTRYSLSYDFTAFQASNPTTPLPADKVEIEFNNLDLTTDQIIDNLNLIQKSDGTLANFIVKTENLAPELTIGILSPTGWATATSYDVNDTVIESNILYRCVVAHTSGVFATDLAAVKWVLIIDYTSFNIAAQAAQTAAEAAQTAAELAETNAETAETNAGISETNAAASEAAAAASELAVNNVIDSIPGRDVVFLTNTDSPYTATTTQNGTILSCDTSGGNIIINFPTIAGNTPLNILVKKSTADANTVTVNAGGTDEIEAPGTTSKILASLSGFAAYADTDATPDLWVTAGFGAAAGNYTVDIWDGTTDFTAGTTTTLTTTTAAGAENNGVLVFDGVVQHHDQWSLSGTTLTPNGGSAIPLGTKFIEFRYGSSLPVGTPGDTTVTYPKLAAALIASQAQAEAGTATDVLMRPLEVAQAIAELSPFVNELLHIQHQETSGTDAGGFTSGAWRTRTLNTVVTNEITGASLATNQITLPAGTYYIEASAPAFRVGLNQLKLRNITDASDELIGNSVSAMVAATGATQYTSSHGVVSGRFTIADQKDFELQHQSGNSQSGDGFGQAVNFGVTEIYADVKIWKVG